LHFIASVEFVMARSVTVATMDSAAASSSALHLVFAATLAMKALVLLAGSSTALFVASVQMLLRLKTERKYPEPNRIVF